jgi:hypothetical protein
MVRGLFELVIMGEREIARLTVSPFAGDLDRILEEPYEKAKRGLKQFPGCRWTAGCGHLAGADRSIHKRARMNLPRAPDRAVFQRVQARR